MEPSKALQVEHFIEVQDSFDGDKSLAGGNGSTGQFSGSDSSWGASRASKGIVGSVPSPNAENQSGG